MIPIVWADVLHVVVHVLLPATIFVQEVAKVDVVLNVEVAPVVPVVQNHVQDNVLVLLKQIPVQVAEQIALLVPVHVKGLVPVVLPVVPDVAAVLEIVVLGAVVVKLLVLEFVLIHAPAVVMVAQIIVQPHAVVLASDAHLLALDVLPAVILVVLVHVKLHVQQLAILTVPLVVMAHQLVVFK